MSDDQRHNQGSAPTGPLHSDPDYQGFVARVFAKYGGRQSARDELDAYFLELENRWEQDTDVIGRILRAHLFVEHFLHEYLSWKNPHLRDIKAARLTFAQKLHLADLSEPALGELRPGIARLNEVRNRLSHNMGAAVNEEDRAVLLSAKYFAAFRAARAAPNPPGPDPLQVLEDFARYSGTLMRNAVSNPFEGCFE